MLHFNSKISLRHVLLDFCDHLAPHVTPTGNRGQDPISEPQALPLPHLASCSAQVFLPCVLPGALGDLTRVPNAPSPPARVWLSPIIPKFTESRAPQGTRFPQHRFHFWVSWSQKGTGLSSPDYLRKPCVLPAPVTLLASAPSCPARHTFLGPGEKPSPRGELIFGSCWWNTWPPQLSPHLRAQRGVGDPALPGTITPA